MGIEGLGFRAIGRVLKVSNVSVLNWIRAAGELVRAYHEEKAPPEQVDVIELDEMWHFVGKKKEKYGFGLHWTEQGTVFLTLSQEAGKRAQEKNSGKR